MGKSLRGMAITAASGGGRALSGTMIVLAIGLLCSLECTVLAVDDGAGLHTADAPAPAEDNLLKLSESAEDQEQLSSEKLENDPIPAPRADVADPRADPYTYKELNGFVIKETAVKLAGDPKDPLLSVLAMCQNACNSDNLCRGFSFKASSDPRSPFEAKCYVTNVGLIYHWGWDLHVRGVNINAQGQEIPSTKFYNFPGMTVHTEVGRFEKINLEQCHERCTELTKQEDDHKCQSYSYNRDKQQCVLSEDRINYDPEYDYYENKQRVDGDPSELSDDTKKRKIIERDEELAAKKAKKLRLKMESKEREEKLAEMQRNQVAKRVAAEAKGKMVANKEVQAKADELKLKETATSKAAREQGEYLESVQKARFQVAHASKNVKKHMLARQLVSSQKFHKKQAKQKEEAKEEKHKITKAKNVSRNKARLFASRDARTHLRIRQKSLELVTQATLLATQQRLSTGQELPGERERVEAETKLKVELAMAKHNLMALQGHIRNITITILADSGTFAQAKNDRTKLYTTKMETFKQQCKDKLAHEEEKENHMKLEEQKKKFKEKASKTHRRRASRKRATRRRRAS